ncbi:hypothetical protein [Endozoicomonas sp. GU-1]|uniref:hypothetical protein n=1 Tax=Endozoicomonas sp. GU-1 TaxID=3009078 RepID=UPI0022B5B6AC|nr:hypothetical protein [Endozoicomonas sp. GU-1]WBA81241.1 hypothetical protein O2T12_23590 [Endozoicomonas sp. GU-1]WBA84187.1 hypothetical protein O3276_12760 [Endozoicomonas sp. GU-1]
MRRLTPTTRQAGQRQTSHGHLVDSIEIAIGGYGFLGQTQGQLFRLNLQLYTWAIRLNRPLPGIKVRMKGFSHGLTDIPDTRPARTLRDMATISGSRIRRWCHGYAGSKYRVHFKVSEVTGFGIQM